MHKNDSNGSFFLGDFFEEFNITFKKIPNFALQHNIFSLYANNRENHRGDH